MDSPDFEYSAHALCPNVNICDCQRASCGIGPPGPGVGVGVGFGVGVGAGVGVGVGVGAGVGAGVGPGFGVGAGVGPGFGLLVFEPPVGAGPDGAVVAVVEVSVVAPEVVSGWLLSVPWENVPRFRLWSRISSSI